MSKYMINVDVWRNDDIEIFKSEICQTDHDECFEIYNESADVGLVRTLQATQDNNGEIFVFRVNNKIIGISGCYLFALIACPWILVSEEFFNKNYNFLLARHMIKLVDSWHNKYGLLFNIKSVTNKRYDRLLEACGFYIDYGNKFKSQTTGNDIVRFWR